MAGLKTFVLAGLGIAITLCGPAAAKPAFTSSEIEGRNAETNGPAPEIFFCDLDGDGLDDAVLVDGLNLSVFYQDARGGFPGHPQQEYRLGDRPALLWPAKLG